MAPRSHRPIPPAPSTLIQALTLAALLVPGAVGAQDSRAGSTLFLPFDVSQGAITNVDGATPYVAGVRLQAALGIGEGGPVRVGPVVAVRFANPDWALAGGIRAQWLPVRFGLGGRRWGVGVLAEQLWDTGDGRPASVGLVADLELVRIHGWLIHDWSDERTGFELGAGTDVRSLWAVLFPADDEPPFPDVP
jgi:hypothetical protein